MRGFSLIEVIVYIALFSLLCRGVFTFMWLVHTTAQDTENRVGNFQDRLFMIDRQEITPNAFTP